MPKVVSVRFHDAGKICRFDPSGFPLHIGDAVIAENAQCLDLGHVTEEIFELPEERIAEPLRPILRLANEADLKRYQEKKIREKDAFIVCQEKILAHDLVMNLVDAQYSFDGKKLVFYFTADNRVDFRELVKDLAAIFRTRIELRQIGVRDQARMVGGLGLCGRELCCCSFLHDFVPVSVKMVKEQGLSMNPAKISGSCGRLMCCLKYEQDAYEDAHARLPKLGDVVMVSQGRGTVVSLDILHERLTIRLDAGEDADLLVVAAEEAEVISQRSKKNAQPPCKSGDGKKNGCPCKKEENPIEDDTIILEE